VGAIILKTALLTVVPITPKDHHEVLNPAGRRIGAQHGQYVESKNYPVAEHHRQSQGEVIEWSAIIWPLRRDRVALRNATTSLASGAGGAG